MTPEDVATSRAAAAEAEKERWEGNREDTMPEETGMVLAIEAYERRTWYQLRDDPHIIPNGGVAEDAPRVHY